MDLNQLAVATELNRDRDRMVAQAFRAGGASAGSGPLPKLPQGLVTALQSLVRVVGHGARFAH